MEMAATVLDATCRLVREICRHTSTAASARGKHEPRSWRRATRAQPQSCAASSAAARWQMSTGSRGTQCRQGGRQCSRRTDAVCAKAAGGLSGCQGSAAWQHSCWQAAGGWCDGSRRWMHRRRERRGISRWRRYERKWHARYREWPSGSDSAAATGFEGARPVLRGACGGDGAGDGMRAREREAEQRRVGHVARSPAGLAKACPMERRDGHRAQRQGSGRPSKGTMGTWAKPCRVS